MEKGKIDNSSITSAKSDNDLIAEIQQSGNNDSYLELRSRYEKVYYRMCHKYLKSCATLGIKEEDILENMDFILFNSARTFDFSRNLKFSTWIANQARYFCLNSMRRGKKVVNTFNPFFNTSETNYDEDDPSNIEGELGRNYQVSKSDSYHTPEEDELTFLSEQADNLPDPVSRQIIHLRYGFKKKVSWREITNILKIDYNKCKEIHDTTLNILRNSLSRKCGFVFENS